MNNSLVGEREGNILDEVGERGEVDIVEDQVGEEHDKVGKGGIWKNPTGGG